MEPGTQDSDLPDWEVLEVRRDERETGTAAQDPGEESHDLHCLALLISILIVDFHNFIFT